VGQWHAENQKLRELKAQYRLAREAVHFHLHSSTICCFFFDIVNVVSSLLIVVDW
jgi:hypothetical protein